jgi:putative hydroxymethylpyrimidine transporter CytX
MATEHSPGILSDAITPVSAQQRVFAFRDHASLWFSLGVGLLVMQMGAYLVPAMGTKEALLAIVAGSAIGALLLGWVAKLGADSGLASAGLMRATFGRGFSVLPIVLNVVQLIGWGSFELVVMRDASVAIFGIQASYAPWIATLFWGAVIALLISGSMVTLVRKLIARIALPLVILSLLWLSWQFIGKAESQSLAAVWNHAGDGSMGVLSALDLVIAMPISWLPLVADYARHGKSGKTSLHGTWIGYAIANVWCYALGVLVALTLPSEDLVTSLLLAQGGLIALTLILIDEVDNAYGDAYSGAVSTQSIVPRLSVRTWGLIITAVATVFALVLPMHALEPFLLMLSSVFVPLFGVILGRLALQASTVQKLNDAKALHIAPTLIWLLGIAIYHGVPYLPFALAPSLGQALPSLVISFALAFATRPKK